MSTTGSGTAVVVLDTASGQLKVDGTYANLTSPATAAHVHGPAAAGATAGILVPLTVSGGVTGTFNGTATLTPTEVTDLLAGLHYVNVHSALFTNGEIRAQIVQAGSATAYGGGNPAGSLALVSGTVKINSDVTFGVDNPLGTQTPGSTPFVAISLGLDPSFILTGVGTPVPGWGMGGPTGELLISVAPPNPPIVKTGPLWTGAGNPSPVLIHIPNQLPIVGIEVYAQGLLVDPFATPTFGLTNGLALVIGL